MNFSELNLNPSIYKAIEICGYKKPTPIQSSSIPSILTGKDIVASAQTGTGKTAAFTLPALHMLKTNNTKDKWRKTRVLILTPTRELATQITKACDTYGKFIKFNLTSLMGGMSYKEQIRGLKKGPDIIVATPGRLIDHIESGRVDLSGVEMLILDEADRMLDMGFIDDVNLIAKQTPKSRQTLLFSATVDSKINKIVNRLLKDPARIDLSDKKLAPKKIAQEIYVADSSKHKDKLLNHFMTESNIYKAIIFSATKLNADKLAKRLREDGHNALALHGDLKQNVRDKTIRKLKTGKIQYIVATDVAARGLDIDDLSHVFNYDLPRFSEDYVHRIGRTGRAGKSGIAISFALPNEKTHLDKIERYVGQKIALENIEGLESQSGFKAGTSSKKKPKRNRRTSDSFKKKSQFKKAKKRYQ